MATHEEVQAKMLGLDQVKVSCPNEQCHWSIGGRLTMVDRYASDSPPIPWMDIREIYLDNSLDPDDRVSECRVCGEYLNVDTVLVSTLRHASIIGHERALLDGLSDALSKVVGGPPASAKTMTQLRRHRSSKVSPTLRGNSFEVQIVGPDGEITGHIVRVTVELDRFEAPSKNNQEGTT